ncbi:DASS family sodium-coupled anion symporter [Alphaproteobacteria bacterium]|nr:DASS family sodium-coupled anion symporter [Alphaproteobacteria bacterium]
MNKTKFIGLIIGIIFLIATCLLPSPESLNNKAWLTLGVAILMATWWLTEAIPLPATGLLPIVLFPLLGISSIKDTAQAFSHPIIFLFMGGFIIGLAMQHTGLHKRIAYYIISKFKSSPKSLVFGFMCATAFLSMWISNSATAIMMLPIALSIITVFKEDKNDIKDNNFDKALVLSIAFSATIGGIATIIGTPPNTVMAAMLSEIYNYEINFVDWLKIGLPTSIILLPITWIILTFLCFPLNSKTSIKDKVIKDKIKELGKISQDEIMVGIVFIITASLWISRKWLSTALDGVIPAGALNDSTIAIMAAIFLFIIPSNRPKRKRLIDWQVAQNIPWGALILIGGGLSLATVINSSGLATWIGSLSSNLSNISIVFIVLICIASIIVLTELTSNTATASTFIPIMGATALGLGQDPLLLIIPATLAASCAFMMPVATPPNTIAYASGHLKISDMIKAGIWLNIISIIIIGVIIALILGPVFDVELNKIPIWAK